MTIKSHITDPSTGIQAEVIEKGGKGLYVITEPKKVLAPSGAYLSNNTYGININQDATVGGTPDKIHNGGDDSLWTASAISGTWDFASTVQAKTGTKSVEAINTVNNSSAQFAKGSALTLASYVSITGWVYVTSWPAVGTKEVNINLWDTTTGQVGDTVNLSNYINVGILNTWQKFSIPIGEFNSLATTIDAIRVMTIDLGGQQAPDYYLDDIQVEETGGPIVFKYEPPKGFIFHYDSINFFIADTYDSTLVNATLQKLPYNSFWGLDRLEIGLVFNNRTSGVETVTRVAKGLGDLLQISVHDNLITGSDGTVSWVSFSTLTPCSIPVNSGEGDKLELIISDDLSGLDELRMSVWGCLEAIE